MKRYIATYLVIALCAVCFQSLVTGCAGTKAQRVLFTATDAAGEAANKSQEAFVKYMVAQAELNLGNAASQPGAVTAWVTSQPEWPKFSKLVERYNSAYSAWCQVNAAAAVTNASGLLVDSKSKQNMLDAAAALASFVSEIINKN